MKNFCAVKLTKFRFFERGFGGKLFFPKKFSPKVLKERKK